MTIFSEIENFFSKHSVNSWIGLLGSVVFCLCGLLTVFGVLTQHPSIFSKAGGAVFALLFLWVGSTYARKLMK